MASSLRFNVSVGGSPIKVVASDVSRSEREEFVPSVVLAPTERYVVDEHFNTPGQSTIDHGAASSHPQVDTRGTVTLSAAAATPD